MRWINVKEKLPEKDTWVLTHGLYDMPQKTHFGSNGLFNGTIPYHMCITHWMPLPTAPKNQINKKRK